MELTAMQKQTLLDLKNQGVYIDEHKRETISEESLWKVLLLGLRMHHKNRFKFSHIVKEYHQKYKNRHVRCDGIPLCAGELRRAIKYGHANGFLMKGTAHSGSWLLTDKALTMDLEGMGTTCS